MDTFGYIQVFHLPYSKYGEYVSFSLSILSSFLKIGLTSAYFKAVGIVDFIISY